MKSVDCAMSSKTTPDFVFKIFKHFRINLISLPHRHVYTNLRV
jgi:hypothetical protein